MWCHVVVAVLVFAFVVAVVVVVVSIYLSIYLPIYPILSYPILSTYLSYPIPSYPIHPSICLSACLSTCKLENAAILRDFLSSWTWEHQKRSNSARLPKFLNLTTSKSKQFCETSSFFEVDNIKKDAILRDFLQKWKVVCRADGLVPMRFAIFPLHLPKVLCLPRKKWCQVIRSAAPVTQNHLPKTDDLMLQNATPLRKSAPGPPYISDEHVSCTAPATENASLQILFKCPTPAIVFGNATKPSRFAHFWQGAQSLAPANAKRQKVVRTCNVLCILTWKFTSRHNGVQLFISHLTTWLRTRRFSEPTFRPSGATNHWKNRVFRDFPAFLRTWIFFLLRLSLFWSSFFFSSLLLLFPSLLFICPCCRKFDF